MKYLRRFVPTILLISVNGAAPAPAAANEAPEGMFVMPSGSKDLAGAFLGCQDIKQQNEQLVIDACRKAADAAPTPRAKAVLLSLRSKALLRSKRYGEAVTDAQVAVSFAPDRWEALNQLCWAAAVSGIVVPSATDACARAVGLSAARTNARHSDAVYSLRTSNWHRAAALFDGLAEQSAKRYPEVQFGSVIAAKWLADGYRKSADKEEREVAGIVDVNIGKVEATLAQDKPGLESARKYFRDLGFSMPDGSL
ncbi:hypothetical protein [Sphingomonas colocasiae]|uniref:Tetratricopeptide repeat protein n=1 Tax=Sphingomonas colocasiae TaxID=1848973 RepID=A0ABS7PPU2_9SPHN|nr:hypothetical protein [Sphingomonas colocasiae]MBY8823342.1 hypothetical protein [Sphingomonas colocasiae]